MRNEEENQVVEEGNEKAGKRRQTGKTIQGELTCLNLWIVTLVKKPSHSR